MDKEGTLFQNMRSMISLIDKLRDFNLSDYVSLPRIAVLGEQSAGKSSLLESIAGITFLPRGTGIVTRRPLELRMIRQNVEEAYFVFPKDYGEKKFFDPAEVTKVIEDLTDKVSGSGKQITNDPIICRIYSSQVPDLTLVDLPGVTRNPVGDQPQNIEQITTDLVKEYCKSEDTIILCVIPANIDLANSHALKLNKEIDPKGERTLGVLTKIDLMDEGTNAAETLLNEQIKLKHGYIGVKGRSQADIQKKIKMEDAIQKELDFFGKHPIYSSLPSNILGTLSLINKVSNLLYGLIQKTLPRIQKEIQKKLKIVKTHLKNIGEEFPEQEEDKMELVFNLVREFKDKFNQDLNGKYYYQKKKQNEERETLTYKINNIFNDLLQEYVQKGFKISKHYTDQEIIKSIEIYQGENIPGFQSFDSFLNLISPKLELIGQPVLNALDECKIILEEKGLEIIDLIFKNYHVLDQKMKEIFGSILTNKRDQTQKILKNIIKCEENYLFTNDQLIMAPKPIIAKKDQTLLDLRVLELRQKLDYYFFIIVRNLKEQVPKLIGKFLILDLNNSFQIDIMNQLSAVNYCIKSLVENKKTLTERERLKLEFQALSKAENLLVNDFGMGLSVLPQITDMSVQAQDILDEEGVMVDDDMIKNIHKINEDFLSLNQQFMDKEKEKLMREFGLVQRPTHLNNQIRNVTAQSSQRKTQQTNQIPRRTHNLTQNLNQTPTNLLSEKSIQDNQSQQRQPSIRFQNTEKQPSVKKIDNIQPLRTQETTPKNDIKIDQTPKHPQVPNKQELNKKFSILEDFKKQRESKSPVNQRVSAMNFTRQDTSSRILNQSRFNKTPTDSHVTGNSNQNGLNQSSLNKSKLNQKVQQRTTKMNNLFGQTDAKPPQPRGTKANLYLDFL